MIKIIDSPNIGKWKEFVYRHPNGNIFQTPEMFDVYANTKYYDPIILAAIDSKTGNILALTTAVIIKEIGWFLGQFTAHTIIQGGPLFIDNENGKEALTILLRRYDEILHNKAIYSEIRNMWDTNYMMNIDGYMFEEHLNFIIDLKNPEELMKEMKRDKKRAIKKAVGKEMKFVKIDSEDRIDYFYEMLKETYKTAKIPLCHQSLFKNVYKYLVMNNNMADFFLAELKGNYIAGRLELYYKERVYDWYAGDFDEYNSYYANEFLIWNILNRAYDNGFSIFDFGGAGTPNESYGVRDFKKQFGGKMTNFGRYKKIYSPIKDKTAEIGFKVYQKFR